MAVSINSIKNTESTNKKIIGEVGVFGLQPLVSICRDFYREEKCRMKSSNIGGQAVMEGIMMRHGEKYSVAVRKPDQEIAVQVESYQGILPCKKILSIPIVRGVFNFIDSAQFFYANFYIVYYYKYKNFFKKKYYIFTIKYFILKKF